MNRPFYFAGIAIIGMVFISESVPSRAVADEPPTSNKPTTPDPVTTQVLIPTAPADVEALLDNMLQSFATKNFASYQRDLDEKARAELDQGQFEQVVKVADALFGTFQSRTYLGFLKQRGYIVYLWKGRFHDSRDDVLIKLSLTSDAKPLVGGFWLQ